MMKLKFAVACMSLVAAGSTQAANRHVDIVNKTGMTLTHFHASTTGTREWEDDILGSDTIVDGAKFDIDIDDGSGACRYDFKAVFEGGGELIKNDINVCQVTTFTYSR